MGIKRMTVPSDILRPKKITNGEELYLNHIDTKDLKLKLWIGPKKNTNLSRSKKTLLWIFKYLFRIWSRGSVILNYGPGSRQPIICGHSNRK
jgi:hypothetical protein